MQKTKMKKRCRDGVTCVVLCTLPSIYLVCVVFGTAIPTSFYIFGKCFSYFTCIYVHACTYMYIHVRKHDCIPMFIVLVRYAGSTLLMGTRLMLFRINLVPMFLLLHKGFVSATIRHLV